MESGMSFVPVSYGTAVGTYYLGSEYDYIVTSGVPEYYFGGGIYEADYEVILPTANAYDFTFTYGGNDAYTGTVYADVGIFLLRRLYPGRHGSDGQTGTYSITGMTPGYDLSLAGQVYVTNYYDQETNQDFTPLNNGTALGTSYLGSSLVILSRAA